MRHEYMIKYLFKQWGIYAVIIIMLSACVQTSQNTWEGSAHPSHPSVNDRVTVSRDTKPVNVAFLVPLSGKGAGIGQALLNASQLALFDLGTKNFNLIPRDTKGTSTGAQIATQEAISNGADLILGPLFSESVRTASVASAPHNVNIIGFTTDQNAVTANSFAMGFLPQTQVRTILKYALTQGKSSFSIIVPQGQYGDIIKRTAQQFLQQNNVRGIHIHEINGNTLDLERLYSNMAAQKSDAILIATDLTTANSVSNFLLAKGLENQHTQRMGLGLWDNTQRSYSSALDGAWYAAPSPQQRERFTRMYENSYGSPPPRIASMGYDATALAISLQKQGASYKKESLTIPNGFYGIDGIFRFNQNGLVERGLAIMSFANGRTMILKDAPKGF